MKHFAILESRKTNAAGLAGRRRGGALVEMALILPVLLSVSFGAVEYGYFFYVKNTTQGAAQTGARAAISSSSTNAAVNTSISNVMSAAGLSGSGYSVTITNTSNANLTLPATTGTAIKVTVTIPWSNVSLHALSSSMGGIGAGKQLTGVAIMVAE